MTGGFWTSKSRVCVGLQDGWWNMIQRYIGSPFQVIVANEGLRPRLTPAIIMMIIINHNHSNGNIKQEFIYIYIYIIYIHMYIMIEKYVCSLFPCVFWTYFFILSWRPSASWHFCSDCKAVAAQAMYDGGYWQSTGIGRYAALAAWRYSLFFVKMKASGAMWSQCQQKGPYGGILGLI